MRIGRRHVLGPNHPYTLISAHNLATAHLRDGAAALAVHLLEKTFVACGRLLGVDHPQTMMSALGLGDAYAALGLDDLATEVHGGVHAAAARTLGPDHELTLAAAGRPSRRHVPGADA